MLKEASDILSGQKAGPIDPSIVQVIDHAIDKSLKKAHEKSVTEKIASEVPQVALGVTTPTSKDSIGPVTNI